MLWATIVTTIHTVYYRHPRLPVGSARIAITFTYLKDIHQITHTVWTTSHGCRHVPFVVVIIISTLASITIY